MYVVFEGIDTCGKSTQIDLLKETFPHALFTKEPGGSALGQIVRPLLLEGKIVSPRAEFFLFLADRAEHIDTVVRNHHGLIISDRSVISGISYAPFEEEFTLKANLFATDNLLPDKIIFLELTRDELVKRLGEKSHDGIESRGIEYLLAIQNKIRTVIKSLEKPAIILNAAESRQTLHSKIKDFIND